MAAHVKLRSVTNGERYALPGVGMEPDFLAPAKFDIQDIVNGHLAPLKLVSGGGYALIEEDTSSGFIRKEFELTKGLVTGLVDQQGAIRMYGSLRGICDADGFVGVYVFGQRSIARRGGGGCSLDGPQRRCHTAYSTAVLMTMDSP